MRELEPQLAAVEDLDDSPAIAVGKANDPPGIEEEKVPVQDINVVNDDVAGITPPLLI